MEFYISKNSTLPIIKMQVVKDGRVGYEEFMSFIETSSVYFSMVDTKTGVRKIYRKRGGFVSKKFDDPNTPTEYYIYYRFEKKDINKTGRYEGQFLLKNSLGSLVLPIREPLFINIKDSVISDSEPVINYVSLSAAYSVGSLVANYTATMTQRVNVDVQIKFINSLGLYNGGYVNVNPTIVIPANSLTGSTEVVLDINPWSLNESSFFSDIKATTTFSTIFEYVINSSFNFDIPTPTPTPTITATKTPTPSNSSTQTPTPSNSSTQTPTPTITETPTPTPTPSVTQTITPTESETPTPTPTPTVTQTPTNTPTPTITETPTPTPTPSVTQTITPTESETPTPTPTNTPTLTESPTSTVTPSVTMTESETPTPTPTQTNTETPTNTPTLTVTPTPSSTTSLGGIVTENLFMELDATNYTSGTWTDESGNGNNGTISGATWTSDYGGVFDFDGVNDFISVAHVAGLSLSTTVQKTVQVWVKFDTLPSSGTFIPAFGKLSSSFAFDGYYTAINSDGTIRTTTNGNAIAKVLTSTSALTTNTWYFLTFITRITATANTTKLYVNETEYITGFHGSDSYNESNPFNLGYIGTGVSSLYLDGKIGACYFYTSGLTTEQISQNYNYSKSKYMEPTPTPTNTITPTNTPTII